MTTAIQPKSEIKRPTEFLKVIQRNVKKDNGTQATLKRALTGEARHLRGVYPLVLPYLGGIEYNQDEWIFVACLFAYYPQSLEDNRRNFGDSARGLASATQSEGAERRFRALLDTALEDMRSPLGAMVRLMKSKGVAINYPKLIVDLCRWEHPDQYVQDQWARAFWGASSKPSEDVEEGSDGVNDS